MKGRKSKPDGRNRFATMGTISLWKRFPEGIDTSRSQKGISTDLVTCTPKNRDVNTKVKLSRVLEDRQLRLLVQNQLLVSQHWQENFLGTTRKLQLRRANGLCDLSSFPVAALWSIRTTERKRPWAKDMTDLIPCYCLYTQQLSSNVISKWKIHIFLQSKIRSLSRTGSIFPTWKQVL